MIKKIKKYFNREYLQNRLKEKNGLNTIETTIIVVVLMIMIMTMLDFMEISQQLSATTSAINYTSRLISRQGGLSNAESVLTNFDKYGHGAYVTTESAFDMMNVSLRKAYSYPYNSPHSVLGNEVEIIITPVYYNHSTNKWVEQDSFNLTRNTEFGVYIPGSGLSKDNPNSKMITQKQVLYHQVYYVIQAKMHYDAFTVEKLFLFTDSYFTQSSGHKTYTKTFSRFVIPSYYNREYGTNNEFDDNVSNDDEWYVH